MDRVRQGLAALAIALTAGCTSLPTRKPLTVCVLNDSLAPVEADIEQITSETIAQYEQHIGVRLELTHKGDWPFVVPQVPYERLAAVGEYLKENDGSHAPMILEAGEKRPEDATVVDFNAVGDAITRACPADIRILFTNKKLYFASVKEGRLRARTITGNYEKGSGSVFLYDVDAQVPLTDACGNPRVETVLKHEIGHKWYGDGHDKDKRSFMHGPAYESCGEWTKEVTDRIRDAVR